MSILGDIIEFNKVYDINKLHPVQKQYIGTIIVLEIANIEYKLNKSKGLRWIYESNGHPSVDQSVKRVQRQCS